MTPTRPKRKIILCATPTLGRVHLLWANAREAMIWPMNGTKALLPMFDHQGGEIAEMRNRVVAMAMGHPYNTPEQEVSHIFWLDDDVMTHPSCIPCLEQHNADVASGVYFCKGDAPQPLIFPGPSCGVTPFVPNQQFETYGWSMGISLVKMSVFRRVLEECKPPADKYGCPAFFHTPKVNDMTIKDGIRFEGGTEDFTFFAYCEQLGIKRIVDTRMQTFGWHLDNHKPLFGYPEKQFQQFMNFKPVTWDTPEGVVTWE